MQQPSNFVIQINSNRLEPTINFAISRQQLREALYPDLAEKILRKISWDKVRAIQVPLGKSKFSAAQWRNIKTGDRVLVVSENRVEYSLIVVGKFSSDKLSQLQPFLNEESNLFFIYSIESQFLPSAQLTRASSRLNELLNSELPFLELDLAVAQVFLRDFELDLNHEEEIQIEMQIAELASLENLDIELSSSYRIEQTLIRKLLLRKRLLNPCFFCGKLFSHQHLVAAHIKQRSKCSQNERLDFRNNVVLACKLGCDHLFELGEFAVGTDGVLEIRTDSLDLEVAIFLEQLPERCEFYEQTMAHYFEWHYSHKFRAKKSD
jgi:hypothetical protein